MMLFNKENKIRKSKTIYQISKFELRFFFGWGLESLYQIFEVIPVIRTVSCGDVRARRSWPWLGFVESEKETKMR